MPDRYFRRRMHLAFDVVLDHAGFVGDAWEENKHPRGKGEKGGQFVKKGGEGSGPTKTQPEKKPGKWAAVAGGSGWYTNSGKWLPMDQGTVREMHESAAVENHLSPKGSKYPVRDAVDRGHVRIEVDDPADYGYPGVPSVNIQGSPKYVGNVLRTMDRLPYPKDTPTVVEIGGQSFSGDLRSAKGWVKAIDVHSRMHAALDRLIESRTKEK